MPGAPSSFLFLVPKPLFKLRPPSGSSTASCGTLNCLENSQVTLKYRAHSVHRLKSPQSLPTDVPEDMLELVLLYLGTERTTCADAFEWVFMHAPLV